MRPYEAMVIVVPTVDDAGLQAAVERVVRLITEQGGTVDRVNPWGKRRLAYELSEHREGYYVVLNFRAEQPVVAELERVLRLSDEVLRHIVVRQEEVPAPAAEEEVPAPAAEEEVPAPAAEEDAPAQAADEEDGAAAEPEPVNASPEG